ncbi:MAG: hypothetical protein ACQESR_10905 [Planctomycetota bacterium]
MESCPTQAVLPLVELAAAKIIRDSCIMSSKLFITTRSGIHHRVVR